MLIQVPQEDIIYHQINLRDAIVHYFQKNSPIMTKIDDRWVRRDNVLTFSRNVAIVISRRFRGLLDFRFSK